MEDFDFENRIVTPSMTSIASDIEGSLRPKNLCDYIVESNDFNDVLRLFNKIYFAKDLEKYIKRLRGKKNGSN